MHPVRKCDRLQLTRTHRILPVRGQKVAVPSKARTDKNRTFHSCSVFEMLKLVNKQQY